MVVSWLALGDRGPRRAQKNDDISRISFTRQQKRPAHLYGSLLTPSVRWFIREASADDDDDGDW